VHATLLVTRPQCRAVNRGSGQALLALLATNLEPYGKPAREYAADAESTNADFPCLLLHAVQVAAPAHGAIDRASMLAGQVTVFVKALLPLVRHAGVGLADGGLAGYWSSACFHKERLLDRCGHRHVGTLVFERAAVCCLVLKSLQLHLCFCCCCCCRPLGGCNRHRAGYARASACV
jgi:hypothetical protein